MDEVLNLYKRPGETPLERLDRLREESPKYKDQTLTYAGRLDPMAEGVMLVLVGEANFKREEFLGLDKEYRFKVLWGVETDTFDILGVPRISKALNPRSEILNNFQTLNSKLQEKLKNYKGKIAQKYPPYSSKPVLGKPLFEWAREGRLSEIEIPEKEVEIYSLEILDNYSIEKSELERGIVEKVSLVKGDFRQEEILECWQGFLKEAERENFLISQIKVSASSGFYVRRLADLLGKDLDCGALALEIVRTRVGEHGIEDSK